MNLHLRVGAIFLIAALTACTSSSSQELPRPTPTNPAAGQHLYQTDEDPSGALLVYNLPLSASSIPSVKVPISQSFLVASNPSNVAVATLSSHILIFNQPLSSTSTPVATITTMNGGALAFTPNGSLLLGTANAINVYDPPFVDNMQPSSTIAVSPAIGALDLAADPNGALYTNGNGDAIGVFSNEVLTQTYHAGGGKRYLGMFATSTQLFAAWTDIAVGILNFAVDVFNLPLTSASTPTATIGLNAGGPLLGPQASAPAGDTSGNLYVAITSTFGTIPATVPVYVPPLATGGKPALVINPPVKIGGGIFIGP